MFGHNRFLTLTLVTILGATPVLPPTAAHAAGTAGNLQQAPAEPTAPEERQMLLAALSHVATIKTMHTMATRHGQRLESISHRWDVPQVATMVFAYEGRSYFEVRVRRPTGDGVAAVEHVGPIHRASP